MSPRRRSLKNKSSIWSAAYKRGMTMWEPQESIVVFCARFLKRRETLRSWSVRRKARRILDLGCGNGSNARFFALMGYEAHGIDIASAAIKMGRAWFAREGIRGHLSVGSVLALPYKDGFFDAVVSHGVLDHMVMGEARKAASESRRVLKPKGLLFLTLISNGDSAYGQGHPAGRNTFILRDGPEKGLPQHYFDQGEIKDLLPGFTILDLRRSEMVFGPTLSSRHSRWQVTAEKS